MAITAFEGERVRKKDGTKVIVNTFRDLIKVGESYKLFHKLPDDKPHWFVSGR